MKNNKKTLNRLLPIISIACIIAVWAIGASALDKEYLLPSVSSTLKELARLFTTAKFYMAIGGTLFRTVMAFVVSFLLAFVFAFFAKNNSHFSCNYHLIKYNIKLLF